MADLVLLRHGESIWNKEDLFTGWADVDLSDKGIAQAHRAAELLLEEGIEFHAAFTSVLKRAIRTLFIVLDDMDLTWVPMERSWRLNEKHCGALQGQNKGETARRHGAEQVHLWRRGFDARPPALGFDDPRHPRFDRRYADADPAKLPATESLKDTVQRVIPYWRESVAPRILTGTSALIVAHGNTLRALVKLLDGIGDSEIIDVYVPTGVPLVYALDDELEVLGHRYLGDQEAVETVPVVRQARPA